MLTAPACLIWQPDYLRSSACLIWQIYRDPLDNVHSTYAFTQSAYPSKLEGVSEEDYYTTMANDIAAGHAATIVALKIACTKTA